MEIQNLRFWGAAVAALFSASLLAQETVERGNQIVPHSPPLWFVRMAGQPYQVAPEVDAFLVQDAPRSYYGKPPKYQPMRIVCGALKDQQGGFQWRYCEI